MRIDKITKDSVDLSADPGDRYEVDGDGLALQSLTITANDRISQMFVNNLNLAIKAKNGAIENPFGSGIRNSIEDAIEILVDDILECGKRSNVKKVFVGHSY